MKDLDYFNIDLKGRIFFRIHQKKKTQLITHLNLIQHFGCPVHTSPSVKVLELSCLLMITQTVSHVQPNSIYVIFQDYVLFLLNAESKFWFMPWS